MPRRLRRLFRLATGRSTALADAQDEVALHLALATEELIRAGLPPDEAARRAARAFGDERAVLRQMATIDGGRERRLRWRERADRWLGDARLAVRGFRRDAWFALSAVLLIGLAVGVNTIAFSVLDAALLRPLPYPDPDRLVWVSEMNSAGRPMHVAGRNLRDWQRLAGEFDGLAGIAPAEAVWNGDGVSELVALAAVSRSFAGVVGLHPMRGRWFSADEARLGGAPAAVVSERFWRSRLGADPNVLNRVLRLDGRAVPIVGVMPGVLDLPLRTDVWFPAEPWDDNPSRTAHNWQVVGRLREGVTRPQAAAGLSVLTRQLVAGEGSSEFAARGALVTSLQTWLVGSSGQLLVLVQATVTLLLLVAALNLTSLLLARTARRQPEVALTVALGARRGDLVRRFVVESLLLAVAGALAGGAIWWASRGALLGVLSRELPMVTALPLDRRLIAFVLGVGLAVGVAAGLGPALWIARSVERGGTMVARSGGRVTRPDRPMRWLVGAEVAATFVLLFGAGVLGRSLARLLDVDPGFAVAGRSVATMHLPAGGYQRPGQALALYDRLRDEAARLPGVVAAGLTSSLPFRGYHANGTLEIQGGDPTGATRVADFRVAGAGYFEAMGIRRLAGRSFGPDDGPGAPFVVLVNQTFVREQLGGTGALGRVVRMPGMISGTDRWATIVGVVDDVREETLTAPPPATVYYSYRQVTPQDLSVVVQAAGPVPATLDRLRDLIHRLDPGIPFDGASLASLAAAEVATPRLRALVIGTFAVAALVLAGFGLFAVLGFIVVRRAREFGVRIALGASRGAILRAALRPSVAPVVVGILAGGGVALVAGRLIRSVLFGVPPGDPLVLAGVALGVAGAAVVAGLGPALRAARTDPISALRSGE